MSVTEEFTFLDDSPRSSRRLSGGHSGGGTLGAGGATNPATPLSSSGPLPIGSWTTPVNGVSEWLSGQYQNIQSLQTVEDVGLFVGTWNVNGKLPTEDITPWIRGQLEQHPPGPPVDILIDLGGSNSGSGDSGASTAELLQTSLFPRLWVFCLQEMVELEAGNLIDPTASNKRLVEWEGLLTEAIAAHTRSQTHEAVQHLEYSVIASKSMVGCALIVIAESALRGQLRNFAVELGDVKTGAGGMGNKGGVGMRMELRDTSLCFISSHLAAHRDKVQDRNDDFHAIQQKMNFEHKQTSAHQLEKDGHCTECISYVSLLWFSECSLFRAHAIDNITRVVGCASCHSLPVWCGFPFCFDAPGIPRPSNPTTSSCGQAI